MKKIDLKDIKKNKIKEKNVNGVGKSYDDLIKTYGYNSNKNLKKINKFTLTPVAKANKKYKYLKKYLKFNNNFIDDNEVVAIVTPDTDIIESNSKLSPAYLIFSNYEKILNWNRSLRFAIAVCTLKNEFLNEL
mgnify:CR=1 FL=1